MLSFNMLVEREKGKPQKRGEKSGCSRTLLSNILGRKKGKVVIEV